jgi:hypothetical protein
MSRLDFKLVEPVAEGCWSVAAPTFRRKLFCSRPTARVPARRRRYETQHSFVNQIELYELAGAGVSQAFDWTQIGFRHRAISQSERAS